MGWQAQDEFGLRALHFLQLSWVFNLPLATKLFLLAPPPTAKLMHPALPPRVDIFAWLHHIRPRRLGVCHGQDYI
jgi:hypothetical protein